jgi:hypothetical protein
VLGYYGVFIGLQYTTASSLTARLDADQYSDEETFTLKMPMAVPYHEDTDQYKRVDGEIEYNGEFYRLVKQKLSKDTLYIVCLKDTERKNIKLALKDYVKTFTDKPVDAKQNTKAFIGFIKDYLPTSIAVISLTDGWSNSLQFYRTQDQIRDLSLSKPTPPPKA